MAESINMQISDRLIERQLLAGRIEAGLRRQVWDQLRILETEIISALKASDPTDFVLLTRRRREVQRLMEEELNPLIILRYERLARMMDDAMGRLAVNEASAVERIVNGVTDTETIEETPSDAVLKRRVAGALFPSAAKPTDLATVGSDWWVRQGQSLSQRINDSLMMGVSQEESLTELARRVKGTAENGLQDGIMAKARADAERLLVTQTTNALGEARTAVGERHPQRMLIEHSAVLDARVSQICLSRNGLRYTADADHAPVGHSIPYLSGIPYHPN